MQQNFGIIKPSDGNYSPNGEEKRKPTTSPIQPKFLVISLVYIEQWAIKIKQDRNKPPFRSIKTKQNNKARWTIKVKVYGGDIKHMDL